MKVALKLIEADTAAQPRTTIDIKKVAEYVDDMQRGDRFPPLIVFKEGGKYWLADGFHRFYAAKTAQLEAFSCDVRDGTLRAAVLFSCSANAAHGLRRTNDDKRRAVVRMLEDAEWAEWGSIRIAKHCGVSDKFVEKYQKEIAALTSTFRSDERKYINRYGDEGTMNVANIGPKSQAEIEDDARQPARLAASLKEIERQIDSMPAPEIAAREFPAGQWYFFPMSKIDAMADWLSAFAAEWRRLAAQRRAS